MTAFPTSPCPSCSAPIIWTITAAQSKRQPVDAEPAADGTIQLSRRHDGEVVSTVLPVGARFGKQGRLHLAHHATCPRPVRRQR
jgi:hypothetical protein